MKENKKMLAAIKFAKVKPNAKIPTKRLEDAGLDIYACFDEPNIIIQPHETKLIPTGIALVCDTDYCFILKERGSTGTKGIAQRCGVIDSGYRDEIFVPVTNTTDRLLVIYNGDGGLIKDALAIQYPIEKAIAQALVIPVPELDIEEYTYEELKAIPSERGCGSLGSSGK